MNIELVYLVAGSSFGFLYILSDSYKDDLTRNNFIKSLFLALTGALASIPLGGLIFYLVMSSELINKELKFLPFLQGVSTFISCIKHKQITKLLVEKLFKNQKNGEV